MSLSRLAVVELQLVMQCCDQRTLLRLARCSRFTLKTASDPFAWRCISPAIIGSALCTDEVAPVTASNPARPPTRPSRDDPLSQSTLPQRLLLGALPRTLVRHAAAGVLLRWTGPALANDLVSIGAALLALESLPRLHSLDLACSPLVSDIWSLAALPLVAAGLTALDVSAIRLSIDEVHALTRHLPRLRTLRCRPAELSIASLHPLTELPQLTDLGWVASGAPPGDCEIISQCSNLQRLALIDSHHNCCEPLLLALRFPKLRELTLVFLQSDVDWNSVFANLPSLHLLTLSGCRRAGSILSAAAIASPLLRKVRIGLVTPHSVCSWTTPLLTMSQRILLFGAIDALLARQPPVRVELRVGFRHAAVSASWLLPLPAECPWQSAVPQWTDFELLRPARHRDRGWSLQHLFPDLTLGCEAPLKHFDA